MELSAPNLRENYGGTDSPPLVHYRAPDPALDPWGKGNRPPDPSMVGVAFRAGTWDAPIWKSVYVGDEYGLRRIAEALREATGRPLGLVVDCGSHIGSFSALALDLGARAVVAVEADRETAHICRANLESRGGLAYVATMWKAVTSRQIEGEGLALALSHVDPVGGERNTGGTVYLEPVEEAEKLPGSISLHSLFSWAQDQAGEGAVDVLKVDIEGGEWLALYLEVHTLEEATLDGPGLSMPLVICMEVHEIGTRADLERNDSRGARGAEAVAEYLQPEGGPIRRSLSHMVQYLVEIGYSVAVETLDPPSQSHLWAFRSELGDPARFLAPGRAYIFNKGQEGVPSSWTQGGGAPNV